MQEWKETQGLGRERILLIPGKRETEMISCVCPTSYIVPLINKRHGKHEGTRGFELMSQRLGKEGRETVRVAEKHSA